ncbi:MAG: ferritin-like domain-containing protein, partial [Polyangiaceae bacterium]
LDDRQRDHWASLLTVAAQEEHASIPSFARALCMLVSLGAPAHLVAKTQHAIGDEIRHARLCATWAERLGAAASEPGPLPEAIAPFSGDEPSHALLDDVFWGGCVGETLAAHRMQARASTAPLPELGDVMAVIADDEARHAALAFETVRWLVDRDDALRERLAAHLEHFASTASESDRATLAPLLAVLS